MSSVSATVTASVTFWAESSSTSDAKRLVEERNGLAGRKGDGGGGGGKNVYTKVGRREMVEWEDGQTRRIVG